MAGRTLWGMLDEPTKRRLLKIDPKFFYMEERFPEIAKKQPGKDLPDPEKNKYDYYNKFSAGYEAIKGRDTALKDEISRAAENDPKVKQENDKSKIFVLT